LFILFLLVRWKLWIFLSCKQSWHLAKKQYVRFFFYSFIFPFIIYSLLFNDFWRMKEFRKFGWIVFDGFITSIIVIIIRCSRVWIYTFFSKSLKDETSPFKSIEKAYCIILNIMILKMIKRWALTISKDVGI
jgi:hypothetical protein